jgi:GR25 family glycosyltransferase involved in LPS biosynthesis
MKNFARLPFHLFHAGYAGLAMVLQSLFVRLDPKPERRRALQFFRNGARLRRMRCRGEQEYPVYVINRACDSDRLEKFSKSCSKWSVKFERVEAINCADPYFNFKPYDSQIAETFYGKKQFLRGAVGCFLSHAKAWEKFLKSGASHALICEDDARFLGFLPHNFEKYGLPQDTDLIFANQRTSEGIQSAGGCEKSFEFIETYQAISALLKLNATVPAIGTDGYILTKTGANKLLSIFSETKVCMEIDWFIFLYSLTHRERELFMKADQTGRFDLLKFIPRKLDSYILYPSLVEQLSTATTIDSSNTKNYIERNAIS